MTLNLPDVALTIRDKYGLNDEISLRNKIRIMKKYRPINNNVNFKTIDTYNKSVNKRVIEMKISFFYAII